MATTMERLSLGEETPQSSGTLEVADHNIEKVETIPDFGPAPDGGARAWLVAAGASAAIFSAMGFSNAFGAFQEYYMTHQLQHKSPDDIAWIGSLSGFLALSTGLVGGPLFDRFGAWIIRPAAIIYVFTIMMISLCKEYWQFMLTQGLLAGLCMGFMTTPVMAAVSQFFDKKRAAALGVAVAGSSIGGIVFPIILSKMLNSTSLGFGWSVRIAGFIMLAPLTFACLAIRTRLPSRQSQFFIPEAFKNDLYVLLILALFFLFLGMFTPLFYMPSYAVSRGMNPTLASYLLSTLNGASTFGRIIPGIMADKWGRLNIMVLAGFSNGIVLLCMNQPKSTAGLVIYSIVFGLTSGMIISGGGAAIGLCVKDQRNMGTYMGMGMAVASLAALIGPPSNGALVTEHHSYEETSILSGVMCLVGGVVVVLCKWRTPEGIFGRV